MSLSLKDLLLHDSGSCSSSGFKSLPRKPCMQEHLPNKVNAMQKTSNPRSLSALQSMINAFKKFNFATMKPPSALPRSLSRRLLSRRSSCKKVQKEVNITVRVKDILRWKSSRDLIQEKSTPLDSDGDDYLHGEKISLVSHCVGRDSIKWTKRNVGPKEELPCEDLELNSPISVLDFQYDENGEQVTSFERNLANMERTKKSVMQKIRRLESLAKLDSFSLEDLMTSEGNVGGSDDSEDEQKENAVIEKQNWTKEKARQLLNCVKEKIKLETKGVCMDQLLLDYFMEELKRQAYQSESYKEDENLILRARALINEEENWTFERMDAYGIRDIEEQWTKLNVEKQELALEVESMIFYSLVDDMILDPW